MARARLQQPLRRLLDEPPPDRVDALFEAVMEGRARRAHAMKRRRTLQLSGGALACAAAAALAWMTAMDAGDPRGAALALAGDAPFPAMLRTGETHRALELSDGSWLTLAAGSRLDLLESSERVFSVALRHGRARFDLRPQGARAFRVECGRLTAEVVGTAFVVERDGDDVGVSVLHGAVLVTGEGVPDRVQRLGAGQHLTVTPEPEPEPESANVGVDVDVDADVDADADEPPTPTPRRRPGASKPARRDDRTAIPGPAQWQTAATDGRYRDAFTILEQGGFERAVQRAHTVGELLQLADIARLSGHPRHALLPLEHVVRLHPDSPQAGIAAFTRGRIQVDRLRDPAGGARDIARALRLGLPQALSEDARARLVEAHARAGQTREAREAAAEYRARHAGGALAAQVDRWSPP